jgi:hypothetical protein
LNITERLTNAEGILTHQKLVRVKKSILSEHIADGCMRCNSEPAKPCEYFDNMSRSIRSDEEILAGLRKKAARDRTIKSGWLVTEATEGRR